MKLKVKLDFVKLPVPQKIEYSRNVAIKIPIAGFFPTPDVACANINAAALSLETAYIAAQGGGKQKTAFLHEVESVLDNLMRTEANYVDRIAKGNLNIILIIEMYLVD